MLQRKQSVFLLMAALATGATFIFAIANAVVGQAAYVYNNYGLSVLEQLKFTKLQDGYLYIPAAMVLIMLLFTITQFKRRAFQIKICRVTYILILVQFALYFFIPENVLGKLGTGVKVNYDVAFYLPLVSLVLTFIAERFIQKDEKLVKSADRLR